MRRIAVVLALAGATVAQAGDWRPLTGAEIAASLTGRKLLYENGAWQDFRASGKTLYNSGRDSWGNWGVRGDQYCSQWPPSDGWDCYGVAARDDQIRFIGSQGATTDATYGD